MSEWIDLSVAISDKYLVYPGDEALAIRQTRDLKNDGYNLNQLYLNMHIGTHVDFPSHVVELKIKEEIDFNCFIGKANIIKPEVVNNVVSTKDLESKYYKLLNREKILLLDLNKAGQINTNEYYDQIVFEPLILDFFLKNEITTLGADIPSFAYVNDDNLLMHKDLLGNNIFLIENLTNLHLLKPHFYFIGLPLKIENVEASLIRAIAKNL